MFKFTPFLKLVICIAIPLIIGSISGILVSKNVTSWYKTLVKSTFNPPNWIFGPAWTLLYILMGIALFLVIKNGFNDSNVKIAVSVFALQLLLNAAWSPVFFNLHQIFLALIIIVTLWLMIIATMFVFWRVNSVASMILVPYLAWVSFASLLNYSIYLLNR